MAKERKIKPTVKQKRAFIYLSENVSSQKEALLKAGYSAEMAKKPIVVTESKGFQVLLDENIPEDLVTKTHKQLIMAGSVDRMSFPKEINDSEIETMIAQIPGASLLYIKQSAKDKNSRTAYFIFPDHARRKDGIDMAYRLRGQYAAEKSLNVNTNMEELMKYNLQKRQANETNL